MCVEVIYKDWGKFDVIDIICLRFRRLSFTIIRIHNTTILVLCYCEYCFCHYFIFFLYTCSVFTIRASVGFGECLCT